MKWFKHFTDMHRGQSINSLMDELGHTGLCFYLLQEKCAEKLDENAEKLDEYAATFRFHTRIVRQDLRISAANLVRLLDACAANGLLTYTIDGTLLEIKMPILLELLNRDTKVARSIRAKAASKARLDKEEERDKDKDKEEDKEKNISTEPKNSVAVVAPKNKSEISISENLKISISQDLVKSWADTYPKEFLETEFKNARNWVLANPHKAPKSQWGKFLNSWFARGWERYRTTLKSNPVNISVDDLNSILGVVNE